LAEEHALFTPVAKFAQESRRNLSTAWKPVYRPQSVTFGEIVKTPDGILQKVFLTGPDGNGWIAAYLAERQADGSWRISGCTLTADDSPKI